MIHSRDVVFDERFTPGLQKETVTKYIELGISEQSAVDNNMEVNTGQGHSEQCEQEQSDKQTLPPCFYSVEPTEVNYKSLTQVQSSHRLIVYRETRPFYGT